MSKAPKRKCVFNPTLRGEFPFLRAVNEAGDRVRCNQCVSEFSISHGGRSDIMEHIKSKKHQNAVASSAKAFQMERYFKKDVAGDEELLLAAQEATFAYHTVAHNISFNASDCSSKLVATMFEPKFTSGRTKTEAIVLKVIVPLAEEELRNELAAAHFVSITMDASNRKEIKVVPALARYFLPEGVKVKLLDFKSVPGETGEILTDYLLSTIKAHDLSNKVVAFCGDNCNTNFGGVKRRGKKNVFSNLKKELGRNIAGVGCGAHIVHNCLQNAVDVFPFEFDSLVVKLYSYFSIYTVRTTQLQEFCEFAQVEYHKLLPHGNTRFLTLLPAIERILKTLKGLKAYFGSLEMPPLRLKQFFEDRCGELYLWFLHGQMQIFNQAILAMEKSKACATDIVLEMKKLKENLVARREHVFIPQGARKLLRVLVEGGECQEQVIRAEFVKFYDNCMKYLEEWGDSFGGGEDFVWIAKNDFDWPDILAAAEKINETVGDGTIDTDGLFNEMIPVKNFWSSKREEWEKKDPDCEEQWVQLFQHFQHKKIPAPNYRKMMSYILCLPGTSAPAERAFSIMNQMWTQERSLLKESTVKGLFICKLNIALTCQDFYKKIKTKKDFLGKVHSSEKYLLSELDPEPVPGTSRDY